MLLEEIKLTGRDGSVGKAPAASKADLSLNPQWRAEELVGDKGMSEACWEASLSKTVPPDSEKGPISPNKVGSNRRHGRE